MFKIYFNRLLLPISICFFVVALLTSTAAAQSYQRKENNVWLNGHWSTSQGGQGLNFGSGVPENVSYSAWQRGFSSASACDTKGNLLFYTDGNIVWNKNNLVMENGWDINNNGNMAPNTWYIVNQPTIGGFRSSYKFDGVVIIPVPGSSHKYYIFTIPYLIVPNPNPVNSIDIYRDQWQGKLLCSVVDMELNGGLGAVTDEHRGITIAEALAGNLHAVTGENCDYWLVGYGSDATYKAFNITTDGIDTVPVVSTLTPPLNTLVQEINISPNRRKAAMASVNEVKLTDFDPATGIFSNEIAIGTQNTQFVAFSPNSNVLYLSGIIGIRQYDLNVLTNPFTLLMMNNLTAYERDEPLRLGPDGKIYLSYKTTTFPSFGVCIQQPDVLGPGCQMQLLANQQLTLFHESFQYPNEIPVIVYDTASEKKEATICFNQPAVLQPPIATDYHWLVNTVGNSFVRMGNDTTSRLLAYVPGKYAVQYYTNNPCTFHRDTFIVKKVNFSLYLGNDPVSCDGKSVRLDAGVPDANYLWSDGSTTNRLDIIQSGKYWIAVTKEGCTASDTVNAIVADFNQGLGEDQVICMEGGSNPITLQAFVPAGANVLWNNGSSAEKITVTDSGWYSVRVFQGACEGIDSIYIEKKYCECPVLFPNAFSPNNDGLNDVFLPAFTEDCPIKSFKLQIYNRWGTMIFVSYDPDVGWNGQYNNQPAETGSYIYRVQMTAGLKGKEILKSGDVTLVR